MNLIDEYIERQVLELVQGSTLSNCKAINNILIRLYENIPDSKRVSYGRVHTLKVLVKETTLRLKEKNKCILEFGTAIYENCDDHMAKAVGLGLITNHGVEDFNTAKKIFVGAAGSDYWDMREFAQMFFKRIIKAHREDARGFLMELSKSADSNIRRFVSETLRPVQENKWMQEDTDYSLGVLKNLFKEKVDYPRKSVGNNLSDLARKNPEMILELCESLVKTKDKNSYSIAYRACRNLVKTYPTRVMDILGVDEYKYKTRKHKRSDYK